MECSVCHHEIKSGEQVFWGSQVICDGPGYTDFRHSAASGDFMVAVHLSCLENSTGAARTPNTVVYEREEEPDAVQRSDALALFD